MIRHKQLFKHSPPDTYGDCQRTVYACLLDIPVEDVPHFGELYWDDPDLYVWSRETERWLNSRGLSETQVVFDDPNLENILKTQANTNPGRYYMLTGMSRNETNHVVIGLDDKIVWDTSIDDSGIVKPRSDGYYVISWLVPLFMKAMI